MAGGQVFGWGLRLGGLQAVPSVVKHLEYIYSGPNLAVKSR